MLCIRIEDGMIKMADSDLALMNKTLSTGLTSQRQREGKGRKRETPPSTHTAFLFVFLTDLLKFVSVPG